MKKIYIIGWLLMGLMPALWAQKVASVGVNKTNVNLRGNPVVLGQLSISAPSAGKVILRFDGLCRSSLGDRIVLAASQTTNWGDKDNCVELEAAYADKNGNPFSHTRAYDVQAGDHTFYAVAQNYYELAGNGFASVYGNLTAEWFPEVPGKPFARHKGFSYEDIFVEGAPLPFSSLTIEAPTSGKVLVRFDGKCRSSYGDLMFFAASNTPTWSNYDGSTSNEVISNDVNRFSFAHSRMYEVGPGSHTFYAVVENYFEIYGNGFASIDGSLTVEFFPNEYASSLSFLPISTPFGVNIEGPPVTLGQIQVDAPTAGKVAVNFAATCIASNGDLVRLAANDVPNWGPADGNISYEPFSSDHNRTSLSHTRVYDVGPGSHTFYAVIQNVEKFEGSGLSVVYGSLSTRFFPDASSDVQEMEALENVQVYPNPASSQLILAYPDLPSGPISIALFDANGREMQVIKENQLGDISQASLAVGQLPAGWYFVRLTTASGAVVRPFLRQ